MAVDLSNMTSMAAQLSALQQQIALTQDPTVKALLQAQSNAIVAQIQAEAQRAQSNIDANNNMLHSLGLFQTLHDVLGGASTNIPSIISLFRR